MAKTNFAALTTEQKTAWGMAFWHHARNNAFISRFLGQGPNSMIQHITELTKGAKGARAVLTPNPTSQPRCPGTDRHAA